MKIRKGETAEQFARRAYAESVRGTSYEDIEWEMLSQEERERLIHATAES